MNIRDWWDDLPSDKRSNFQKYGAGIALILVLLASYYMTGRDEKKVEIREDKRELTIGTDLLEDDIRSKVNEDMEVERVINSDQSRRLEALELMASELQKEMPQLQTTMNKLRDDQNSKQEEDTEYRAPTGKPLFPEPPAYSPGQGSTVEIASAQTVEPKLIGGIGRAEGATVKKEKSTKKKKTIYLPPSFMKGILLTGIEAETAMDAKAEPEPIMIRIQAPAILPNSLKANLKGCFVVASAHGKLNKERVEARLISMHCMALNGEAVIDQEVKGMVVDADGKKGLAGIVVSKQGAILARTMIAGVFGGLGEAVTLTNTTTSTSPLGVTQVMDPEKALQSGLGQGIKSGAMEMQKFYMELARQSTPVIEIGAGKELTVVITEGAILEIKETNEYEI